MKEKLILLGGGGHARSIMDSLKGHQQFELVGIVDSYLEKGTSIHQTPIIGGDEDLPALFEQGIRHAFIAIGSIGNSALREKCVRQLEELGFNFPNIIDPTAIISESVQMGNGNFIGKRVVLNTNVQIGSHCILNTGAVIEHECKIDDFCHIAPGSILCGNVQVGFGSHIGAGSIAIQGVQIGKRCLIGSGSNIIHKIESYKVAYGNPCKEIKENE